MHTRAYAAVLMKVIGGARRPGASGVSFRGACGGEGARDEASSHKESGGELGVGIWCDGSLSVILPNPQSINGLKWVSQLCPRTIQQSESNEVT